MLVYFTWKYALGAKNLKVVYSELGRSKQLEDDLEKSREESKRKSFFLNALSHDLRTPLNGLMLQATYAEMSREERRSPRPPCSRCEISGSTRSTAELLDSLLEYAQVDWADDMNNAQHFQAVRPVKRSSPSRRRSTVE